MANIDVKDAFLTVRQKHQQWRHASWPTAVKFNIVWGVLCQDREMAAYSGIKTSRGALRGTGDDSTHPPSIRFENKWQQLFCSHSRWWQFGRWTSGICLSETGDVSAATLRGGYQIMRKPGDEVSFLKKRMTLQHDAKITIETHHKHVDQMCSLLGSNRK